MKKILFPLVVFVLLISLFNFTIVTKRINNTSSIALQNVEALSYAETTNGLCFGLGSLDCPLSESKVRIVY